VTDTSVRPDEASSSPDPKGEIVGFDWKLALLLAGLITLGVLGGLGWFVMVVAIIVMIFLHELGHYLTAKWSGMKVTEFFLFFGPKIWSFHRGETEYGVKCIPLGAYVRIIGMSNVDTDVPPEDEARTYRQQSYPKRVLVTSAGSLMHLLQALVLFFLAFCIVGVPGGSYWAEELGGPPATWTVDEVSEDSGAEAAGIEPGDQIVSIAGEPVQAWEDVGDAVVPRAGDTVTIELVRDGQPLEVEATIGSRAARPGEQGQDDYGFLGIGPEFRPMATYRVDQITVISV
jgi:membrane-associated protease RseP (regulator of RpoE activity)